MKFTVVNLGYPMEVHRKDCQDVTKALHKHGYVSHWDITGENVADAVKNETAELNSQFDHQYESHELLRIMPCCKG